MYAWQRSQGLSGLTGVDDPYESPPDPAMRLNTEIAPDAVDILERELRTLGHL